MTECRFIYIEVRERKEKVAECNLLFSFARFDTLHKGIRHSGGIF